MLGLALGACGDSPRRGGGGGDDDDTTSPGEPCKNDTECKGDRICVQGTCVDPSATTTSTPSGSTSGQYADEIEATCQHLEDLGCPVPSFGSYAECVSSFQSAFATCGDQADLPSYMGCLQTYATCDPETGEVIAYECFGVALNVSWCFGGGTDGGGGAGGGSGGSGSGGFDGGTGGTGGTGGSGGFDGGV
jgi:hypothetical protein